MPRCVSSLVSATEVEIGGEDAPEEDGGALERLGVGLAGERRLRRLQIEQAEAVVRLRVAHPNYGESVPIEGETRASLAADLAAE